ncbi:MAG TPA: HAMP domain-containing sensor histidine kinase [Gemmatimonadaceae bacterium]
MPEPSAPESPPRPDNGGALIGLVVLIALIIAIDIVFPGDVSIGVLYVLPILAGVGLRSVRAVYILTPVMVAANYLFLWFGPPPSNFTLALINRSLSAIALIGVAMLVARQIRSTLAVEEQRRQLARMVEMKTEFVRAVSHDIRGPIGAILGYTDLLLPDDGVIVPPEMEARLLRGIQRSAQGMLTLTDNLLNAARLDTDEFPVEFVPFDLASLVSEIVAEIGAGSRASRVAIDLEPARALIITSDPLRVRQIVLNLLSNALKFTPADSVVDVRLEACENNALVHVRDRGPGIAPAERERIFEPFYQTTAGRAKGGYGVGLPLARRLARLLGGDIELDSALGQGSTFTLRLPVGA